MHESAGAANAAALFETQKKVQVSFKNPPNYGRNTNRPPKKRFSPRTENSIVKLLKEKNSKNTQQITKNEVKTLRELQI